MAHYRPPRARTWDPVEILQIIDEKKFTNNSPYFRLDVKSIQDSRKSYSELTTQNSPQKPAKQQKLDESRATCGLTIFESFTTTVVAQESVGCKIRMRTREEAGQRHAKIELDRPFRVYCQDLESKGGRSSAGQRFSMQITLQAADLNTHWPPIDLHKVPRPERDIVYDVDGSAMRIPLLVAQYSRFPQCPAEEQEASLQVTVSQDGRQYKPKLCLQVDARWVEPEKASDRYDGWRKHREAEARKSSSIEGKAENLRGDQPPSPTKHTPPSFQTKTVWRSEHRQIRVAQNTFDGIVCPLCNGKVFQNFEPYCIHLLQSHDMFKFDTSFEFLPEHNLFKVSVKIEIKDTYETGPDGSKRGEGENFIRVPGNQSQGIVETLVMRPFDTFFDLQQYLTQGRARHQDRLTPVDRRGVQNGRGSRSGSAFDSGRATPTAGVDLTRPASKVPDLVPPQRKKYPVPPAPDGVIFFSSRIKRPLMEGELLSESDDDIDDEWLLKKQDARTDVRTDLTSTQKKFIKRHDRFLLREKINSNLQYRECLVRFCRLNKRWLARPEMRREFAVKLTALLKEGVIRIENIIEYMDIVNESSSTGEGEANETSQEEEEVDKMVNAVAGCFFARCAACNEPIASLEDIEYCINPVCQNDCHIRCSEELFGSPYQESEPGRKCLICVEGKPRDLPSALDQTSSIRASSNQNSFSREGTQESQRNESGIARPMGNTTMRYPTTDSSIGGKSISRSPDNRASRTTTETAASPALRDRLDVNIAGSQNSWPSKTVRKVTPNQLSANRPEKEREYALTWSGQHIDNLRRVMNQPSPIHNYAERPTHPHPTHHPKYPGQGTHSEPISIDGDDGEFRGRGQFRVQQVQTSGPPMPPYRAVDSPMQRVGIHQLINQQQIDPMQRHPVPRSSISSEPSDPARYRPRRPMRPEDL